MHVQELYSICALVESSNGTTAVEYVREFCIGVLDLILEDQWVLEGDGFSTLNPSGPEAAMLVAQHFSATSNSEVVVVSVSDWVIAHIEKFCASLGKTRHDVAFQMYADRLLQVPVSGLTKDDFGRITSAVGLALLASCDAAHEIVWAYECDNPNVPDDQIRRLILGDIAMVADTLRSIKGCESSFIQQVPYGKYITSVFG